ncbi:MULTISPECIES: APC family permease [unclassified Methanoregula]|uniref:APC family permease n=1 Tax=unclassified Methanoregula TaxID=2649730 RepID=UPI0009C7B169|nr:MULTISPECIES: amino acid permease [unclassified Methanoregula]OPX62052.1 MAG: putative transporter [Methanoregula sp. PtaB.Bin085]OPY36571.1 MAG: putative transporter [Methanoregula sp. PtaU1.Bin006]
MQDPVKDRGVLGLPQVIALYTGAVLGSGILILPGLAAELSGPASLVAWAMMALLVVPMALTMGFLAARYPDAGGVSSFVARAFNPEIGSLVGWFFLLSTVVAAPVIALTGAGYLCAATGLGEGAKFLVATAMLATALLVNYLGMRMTGQVQVAVVLTIIIVLVVAIIGSVPAISMENFFPFLPNGWMSVGHTAAVIFWCFLGWEAISHISGEFADPQKDTVRGTLVAAAIVSILYILSAIVVIGTMSYGAALSDTSLVHIIRAAFGPAGAVVAGIAALFICIAPAIAYTGAASRLTCSLARNGFAPRLLAWRSATYHSPAGGLLFLAASYAVILLVSYAGAVPLSVLIQVPSGTFILTYVGGCAAGIVLLKGSRWGVPVSIVSLLLTGAIFLFVGWAVLYPLAITAIWCVFMAVTGRYRGILANGPS